MFKTLFLRVIKTRGISLRITKIADSHRTVTTCKNMEDRKLHCCANLPFLFKEEKDVLLRFRKARKAGFQAIEYPCPEEYSIDDVVGGQEENNLMTVMMNSCLLGSKNGLAALPGMQSKFMESIKKSIEYCNALKCSRLHVVAGIVQNPTEDHDSTYEENIRKAVDMCAAEEITVLIEPISPAAVPYYYLNNFDKAIRVIGKINSPYLKLQVDLYHLQRINGNLTGNIEEWFPLIGHIQVAQVPSRNEPNTSGEINYEYIFNLLSQLNYDQWIGFEYSPKICGNAAVGLTFIDKMGLTLKKFSDIESEKMT